MMMLMRNEINFQRPPAALPALEQTRNDLFNRVHILQLMDEGLFD